MRLTGTCVLVLSVLVFAGSAYAGNGNGNGNGGGAGNSAPGNSANAPGQQKKDAPPAPETTTTATSVATTTTTASNAGVKPSSSTAHDTHAKAQSDETKQYGNGQTAGQIAQKNGAPGSTDLHGPGNSQPHKATPCSGRHEVDVHALKGKHNAKCGSTPDPKPDPKPTPDPKPDPKLNPAPTPPATSTTAATPSSKPGSRGSGSSTSHGVLSGTQAAGKEATLPFTGQALWLFVLAGLVLIATGLALRQIRTDEACVESGHEQTDRARHDADRSRRPFGERSGR